MDHYLSHHGGLDWPHDTDHAGEVALPVDAVTEPFVDCNDIAEVATEALLEERHAGHLYELTGPRLLTFGDAISEIARAAKRPIRFTTIPLEEFTARLASAGLSRDEVSLVSYLFSTVLDGRNSAQERRGTSARPPATRLRRLRPRNREDRHLEVPMTRWRSLRGRVMLGGQVHTEQREQ